MPRRPKSPWPDGQVALIVPSAQEPTTDVVRCWLLRALVHAPTLPRLHGGLVAEELVRNAREHAEPPYVLRLSLDTSGRSLRLFVDDWDPSVPAAWSSGAGLALVDALSRGWGVVRCAGVKTVWAEIQLGARIPGLVSPPPQRGADRQGHVEE